MALRPVLTRNKYNWKNKCGYKNLTTKLMKMKCGTWTYLICLFKLLPFKNNHLPECNGPKVIKILNMTCQFNSQMKIKQTDYFHFTKKNNQTEESEHTRYKYKNVFDKFDLQKFIWNNYKVQLSILSY